MSTPIDAIEEALEWAGLEDGQASAWAPTVVGCLRAHGFAIVPRDPPYTLVVAGKDADLAIDQKYRDSDIIPLRSERVTLIWQSMIDAALAQTTAAS